MHRWCRDATDPAFGTVWFLCMKGGAKKATARLEEFNKKFSDATLHKFLGPSQFSRAWPKGVSQETSAIHSSSAKINKLSGLARSLLESGMGVSKMSRKLDFSALFFPDFFGLCSFCLFSVRNGYIEHEVVRASCSAYSGGGTPLCPPLSEHYTLLLPSLCTLHAPLALP